ncbi:hypothetical protein BBH99_18770 [Chryseobacterium contaminans]|uniref:DUF3304 domain-containing protein n=2 Tax=Chryseobacterium contaminans TaxID=1423959 RepID=A0A1M7C8X9_9FLAO|nr:hypothetical protein BBH99_18770 [Chryseobacterium contaminans]SHL63633.1 hypothetical protein SAMN05444407_105130 [Chryseobacterium contaminans]
MKKIKNIALLLPNLLLIISCGPKDKFEWNAGISAPKNYISGGPFVEYFYQGKGVAGTSANVGINPGWGMTSGGYTGGDFVEGVIYFVNKQKQDEVMRFRLGRFNDEQKKLNTLPKGFVVPKWEGRIPLQKPTELEYWQEE